LIITMKPSAPQTLSVFSSTDYRQYVRDRFMALKRGEERLSYKDICPQIGIKSTGHLTLILQGRANISVPLALRIAKYLGLNKRESEFFQYLVLFNQAKTHADKRDYFEKIMSFKESAVRLVHADQYEYYDQWYHAVVRALLSVYKVKDDFETLAKAVTPAISVDEARKSIELLVRLGLVNRDDSGYFRQTEAVVDTGATAGSVPLTNYALGLLDLGKGAFDRFDKEERLFSWVTLGVSKTGYGRMVEEMRAFRRKMYEIAAADGASERVYQVNIQAFPVSTEKSVQ